MNTLFSANPTDKQVQEPVRVGGQADPGVRFQFNDALNFVVIPVQHVILIRAHAIGHCFSAGELALGFHIHMHVLEHDQRGIDDRAYGQRIIHGGSGVSALLGASQIEIRELGDEVTLRAGVGLQFRQILAELQANPGPQSDFVAKLADFYLTRSEKSGYSGAAMYDPLAVGTVIDPTLVMLKDMHVDVETKGEFTRGETVANRMGSNENNVLHGDHYEIEGVIELKPNARVCLTSDADRFLDLFVSRIRGK